VGGRGQGTGGWQRTGRHDKGTLMGGLTALALVVVAYTLVASKLDRWGITGPMVFVAAGVILGPGGLDVLPLSLTDETVLTITELTLALLLFSDASTVRLRDVEGDTGLPRRLLFVGLPLTIIAGALLAYLMFPEVGWAAAALIATILAPTDAALGLAVVTNKGRSGADPTSAECRERAQRWHRDATG